VPKLLHRRERLVATLVILRKVSVTLVPGVLLSLSCLTTTAVAVPPSMARQSPQELSAHASTTGSKTVVVNVGQGCTGTSQLCGSVSLVGEYNSLSALTVVYTAAPTHCSNVAVLLFVDGKKVAMTGFVPANGSTSATVAWPTNGEPHSLGIEGEGEKGGCNGGALGDWAGTLSITYTPAPSECSGLRIGASIRTWKTDETIVDYSVSNIKAKCGPVTVTIGGVRKTLSSSSSTASGVDDLPGRFCQTTAYANQRNADTGGPIGQAAIGEVLFARDLTGPDGEQLKASDPLCFEETHRDVEASQGSAAISTLGLKVGTDGVAYLSLTNSGHPTQVLFVPAAHVDFSGASLQAAAIQLTIGTAQVSITPPQSQSDVPDTNLSTPIPGLQSNGTTEPCTSNGSGTSPFVISGDVANATAGSETLFSCPVDLTSGSLVVTAGVTFEDGLNGEEGGVWAPSITVHGAVDLSDASVLSAAQMIYFTG
jgi:hypothetical protein